MGFCIKYKYYLTLTPTTQTQFNSNLKQKIIDISSDFDSFYMLNTLYYGIRLSGIKNKKTKIKFCVFSFIHFFNESFSLEMD